MPVINRHIINPDITYEGLNRDDLFSLINRWKRLLAFEYGATKGQTIALAILSVNPNHIACVFAAAELGLKLFIITKPLARETIHATKMGIFGPVDITVSQEFYPDDLHNEMISAYSKKVCFEKEIDSITDDTDFVSSEIAPETEFIFASTSGTTGPSKPVIFTHGEVLRISKRNIPIFNITKNSVMQHTTNMHHASSMLTSLFPSLMVADKHYYGGIAIGPIIIKAYYPLEFIEKCIIERGVDTILMNMGNMVDWFINALDEYKDQIHHTIRINLSGFTVPERFYEFTKKYPVEFYSHYGSIDTGIPLLVNHVTKDSVYEEHLLGITPDDFYTISDNSITCDLWESSRNLPDKLDFNDGKYYFNSRIELARPEKNYTQELRELLQDQLGDHTVCTVKGEDYLIIWNSDIEYDLSVARTFIDRVFYKILYLNKLDFMVDTKVSMEQLRAYLEHHYAV